MNPAMVPLFALLAGLTGLLKFIIPARLPRAVIVGVLFVLAALVLVLAIASHMITGSPFELVSAWVGLATSAVGTRELLDTATGGASSKLPTLGEGPPPGS